MSYENRHTLRNGDIVLYTRNGSPTYHARLKIPGVSGYVVKSTKRKDLIEASGSRRPYDDLKYKRVTDSKSAATRSNPFTAAGSPPLNTTDCA